ncbi:MAG TPA: ATP synthase F1 subunit gamma [Vicinamibacterales bacterium]|nr:ATP synthase F1 subunit gamma [Vicinamibacterales bacterium]
MPSLIDLRRRIRAVKSTQQITKAMKMISASKLRRAQERIFAARPYADEMRRVLGNLAHRVDPSAHPLLALRDDSRPGARTLLLVVSADKGLCGSFNTNIIKAAAAFIVGSRGREVTLGLVGRKGRDFFRRRSFDVAFEHVGLFQRLSYGDAQAIARAAVEEFTSGRVDGVQLVYTEFKSVMQQRVVTTRVLPIPREEIAGGATATDYLYEPAAEEILRDLVPRHVEVQIYRALLESNAAFYAASMTAMDTATKNSADMIEQLTLYMNKVRQAAITREIIEVVSGAQAL